MKNRKKITAVVLAGGQGRRMQSNIPKQYLLLNGKPILYYSLMVFEQSRVDEIVLVTGEEEREYCRKEIVERFGFQKVRAVVAGGKERYHSVYAGLKSCLGCDYVMIHDGARPFLTEEMIERSIEAVERDRACAVGMPVKDTIKICDENGYVEQTPKREQVWMIQTPQSFEYCLIERAYRMVIESGRAVTDDAMAVEVFLKEKVRLVEGSYMNIKITTPEDLIIAEQMMKNN